jgi:serum/glucocorticoid-regulated kinase 2
MSWKLTKKLKETHLAPLANTFSRSSSTSTIVGDQTTPKASSSAASATTLGDSRDNGIAASEANAAAPAPPLRPGILIVTLHEGQKFSLPAGAEQQFSGGSHHQGSMSQGGGLSVAGSMRPGSSSRNPAAGSYTNRPQSAAGSINAAPTIHGRYSSKHLPYALVDFDKQQVFINAVSGTPENPLWAGSNTQYKFDVSRVTDLTVSLYIRNPSASPNAGRNEDIFIGTLKVHPRFEESRQDSKNGDGSAGQAGADWIPVQFGSGQMKVGVNFVENRQDRLAIDDFELLKVVGKGSFGKVMQVQKKDTHRIYALKTIRKAHIISRSEVAHTLAERSVLAQINNPFIVPLKFSFQSPEKLYLVLAFVNGGELFHHLQKEQRFDINRARFYAAELLCALECLHGFNVIYRDLKPENILLDYTGHIALCDFGLCKLDMKDEDRTNSKSSLNVARTG